MTNRADYRLSLEGRDLGPAAPNTFSEILRAKFFETIAPRLLSLTLTEKRGGEADELELRLSDHDGALEIPKDGAVLALQLGWRSGPDVTAGLVDKGRFKVDEASWEGPPDVVCIRARSADFAAGFHVRREKPHVATTIGAIVGAIAADQGLSARVDPALGAIALPVLDQDGMSDAAMLRTLGRRHDAAATVKGGALIFAPIGAGVTATGRQIPAGTIVRASGDRASYRRGERGQHGGVEARWHDKAKGERHSVHVDRKDVKAGDKPPKRLKRTYASEKSARHAASAAAGKMQRAAAEFDIDLALGRPDLYPERPMTVTGFKPEIDARRWLIAEVQHTLDAGGGMRTSLKLEAR